MCIMMCEIEKVVLPIKTDLKFALDRWPKYKKATQGLLDRIEEYLAACGRFCDMNNLYEDDRTKSEPIIKLVLKEASELKAKIVATDGDPSKEDEERLTGLIKKFSETSLAIRKQHAILAAASTAIRSSWEKIQRDYSILVECIRENDPDLS